MRLTPPRLVLLHLMDSLPFSILLDPRKAGILCRIFHLKKYLKTIMSRLEKMSLGVKISIRLSEVKETKEAEE